jgi:hypothetical protein
MQRGDRGAWAGKTLRKVDGWKYLVTPITDLPFAHRPNQHLMLSGQFT